MWPTKKRKVVWLKILDHSSFLHGLTDVLTMEVIGMVAYEDDVCYKLLTWVDVSEEPNADNHEGYVILKSAILKKKEWTLCVK